MNTLTYPNDPNRSVKLSYDQNSVTVQYMSHDRVIREEKYPKDDAIALAAGIIFWGKN